VRHFFLSFALLCALVHAPARAAQCAGPQLGTWRLLSFTSKDVDTGETTSPYGLYPTGFLSYTPDCRMYEILVREHRAPPAAALPTDLEKSALFDSFLSYSGSYAIDGSKVSHRIEASSNESWTGNLQALQLRIEGNTLYLTAPPARNTRDGKVTADEFIWTRMQ
jgi:Lipocalin-like domain